MMRTRQGSFSCTVATWIGAACALVLACNGCSSLVNRRLPQASFMSPEPPWDDGYKDFGGVIHVHTDYSHDAHGHFEEAMRAANNIGLDYVIITEHNTLKPLRDGRQGWHGATLALIGVELNTRGGHYLAANVKDEINGMSMPTQQVIEDVTRQGGVGFLAHPHFKKHPWKDWAVQGFTGCEIFNAARDILDSNMTQIALWTLSDSPVSSYLTLLDRPTYPLRTWDALIARHGRVVGIGGADAHEVHVFGVTFAPYEEMFRMVRTHVLLPQSTMTEEGIYDALRRGHVYVGIPLVAATAGFSFMLHDQQQVIAIMGDEVPFRMGLQLSARLPLTGRLKLYKDGKEIADAEGQVWEYAVQQPGVYRVEVSRDGKPWLFSNPIYIRPASPPLAALSNAERS